MLRKRSSKTQDIEQIAADILEEAVGKPAPITPAGKKNPAAADSKRVGNVKRGVAKAKPKAKPKVKKPPLKRPKS